MFSLFSAAVSRALCVRHRTWGAVGQHTLLASCIHPKCFGIELTECRALGWRTYCGRTRIACPPTPFQAHGVQWFGWLGRHPRTHMIFSGIVPLKDTHSRDPKTPFLAHGAQWFGWLGRHPRTHIFSRSSQAPCLALVALLSQTPSLIRTLVQVLQTQVLILQA